MVAGVATQGFSQRRDRLGQVVFLDHAVRPHRPQQLVLGKHPVAVLDQVQQHLERLRRQRDGGAVGAAQLPGAGIESVAVERVLAIKGRGHARSQKVSVSFSGFRRTYRPL
jgi:hypothetical protein